MYLIDESNGVPFMPIGSVPVSVKSGANLSNALATAVTGENVLLQAVDNKATTWTHSATISGTGAISATVIVEGSNDPLGITGWFTLCTLTPSGTTTATDAITGVSACPAVRHRCTAIAGTSASVVATSCGA